LTDDERRNRNPAVERMTITRAEIEAMPPVAAADLEEFRVYVLQSARNITTMNYKGRTAAIHPYTFDTVLVHHFHGPRANVDVFLAAVGGGQYTDAHGTKITVRLWTGADA